MKLITSAIWFLSLALGPQTSALANDPLDQWQWRNPSPAGNTILAVTYQGGSFYGVGGGGMVVVSQDGTNWAGQSLGTPDGSELESICWANGFFVAVGHYHDAILESDRGLILTSSDGIDWRAQHCPDLVYHLSGIAYAGGTFVAVGIGFDSSGANYGIISSTDGINWSPRPTGTNREFRGIAHGAGVFVAVGPKGSILTSTDGLEWTEPAFLPTPWWGPELDGITYAEGIFVASGGALLTSPDGQTWTLQDMPNGALLSCVYAQGTFVAVGVGFTQTGVEGAVFTSKDAVDWVQHSGLSLGSIYYGGGLFIGLGYSLMGLSTNGLDWAILGSGETTGLNDAAYGKDRFIAVGDLGKVLHSSDGAIWEVASSGCTNDLEAIAFGGGSFVAVGREGKILCSTNGLNWAVCESGITNDLSAVAFGTNVFVAVGEQGTLLTSSNGLHWTVGDPGTSSDLTAIGFTAGYFTLGAVDGTILTSADCVEWSPQTLGAIVPTGIAYGNDVIVVAGGAQIGNTQILSSTNSVDWIPHSYDGYAELRGLRYGHGTFVLVGHNGKLLTSTNGADWIRRQSGAGYNLSGVAYGRDSFIVVGGGGTILQSGTLPSWDLRLGPVTALPSGGYTINISGPIGRTWQVETSMDLLNWNVLTNIVGSSNTQKVVDESNAGDGCRFYRATTR